MINLIKKHIKEHLEIISLIDNDLLDDIYKFSQIMIQALKDKKTLFWCGNGGSCSDSQHLSAELIGRFNGERRALRSISLTSDSTALTCISNDYKFDKIFSRQIEALGNKGDLLIAISTSGKSQNILNALDQANNQGLTTLSLLGKGGGDAVSKSKHSIVVPSLVTARIQEAHILVGHILCDLIEEGLELKQVK